jgi:hypothetical protein
MEAWLASVEEMEASLDSENEIEATVGEMLLPDPRHRITAKEAVLCRHTMSLFIESKALLEM